MTPAARTHFAQRALHLAQKVEPTLHYATGYRVVEARLGELAMVAQGLGHPMEILSLAKPQSCSAGFAMFEHSFDILTALRRALRPSAPLIVASWPAEMDISVAEAGFREVERHLDVTFIEGDVTTVIRLTAAR